MTSGTLFLWVRETDRGPWGLLQQFSYDDANRRKSKRRPFTLLRVERSMRNWRFHYYRYANADFCIEEQSDPQKPPVHVSGRPRVRTIAFEPPKKKPGGLKRKPRRKPIKKRKSK